MRVEEYGLKWEIDPNPKKGQLGLLRENHYRMLFADGQRQQSFKPMDRWLDIGANIGAFALRAAQGGVRGVIAVEPDPDNYLQLERNIEINGFPDTAERLGRVYPLKAAIVGGESRWVELALSNSFTSTHRLGRIRGRKTITVAGLNINEVLRGYNINKIKIDCEGTEAEILENLTSENYQRIEELVFEYHFSFLKDHDWKRFYAILIRLQDEGFSLLKYPKERSKTWHTIVWAVRL